MMENDYLKIAEHVEKYGKVQNLMAFVYKENLALKHKAQAKSQ